VPGERGGPARYRWCGPGGEWWDDRMSRLPRAVTFLFTDIEGSTRLVKALRERYPPVLAEHRRLVRAAIAAHGGREVDTQGDAFFAAFGGAKQAVLCALEVQRALAAHPWPEGVRVRVRAGIHTGQAVPAGGGYTGLAVHRAARICAAARGGQVLVSQATQTLIEDEEEGEALGFTLVDAGEHQLKDLDRPVRLFRLAAAGLDPLPPPSGRQRAAGPGAVGEATGVHGFASALTSFVGRVGEVHALAGLLADHRLVTVTGPGGSGKTRLAGEVARQVAGRFADGVWLAELAPVADAALVPSAVAAALGVREQPGVLPAEAVARVLARQQVLLVLDNCEHVIGAAAELCAGLVLACDDVRVLATSREPLRVAGEARYRLGPLSVPGPDELAEAARAEAVALFADRARSGDMHFALDGQTGPAVAQIVARLDGMPLAIELAAARVEALGVDQLLDRLDDRFKLLAAGDRLVGGRHRSLAAAVEWSYRLLDEGERRVFRHLSVFPGPFPLEAAEAVAGTDAGPAVLHLVDCSLLAPPRPGPDGRSRYAMLETLRAYGTERLAQAGEQARAAAALAGWALGVAEEAAAGLQTTTGELAAARRLDAEDTTMRQALAWAMGHDPDVALRLAVALAPWWLLRGRAQGGYPLLLAAAGQAEAGSVPWCAAQDWLGRIAADTPDLTRELGHHTAVRDAIGNSGPSRTLAECLAGRALALANLGRLAEAAGEARRCLAVAREIGDPAGEARGLYALAVSRWYAEPCDFDEVIRLARQAQQIPADLPGPVARSCSSLLAGALAWTGDLAAAEPVLAAALARSREVGDLRMLAALLGGLADLDLRAGRVEDAATHLREELQVMMRAGGRFQLRNILHFCGFVCAAAGRPAEALTAWAASFALSRREGFMTENALHVRRREAMREARQALGETQARAAEERGAAMSSATAAEYALTLTAPSPRQHEAAPGLGQLSARERELVTLVAQGRTNAQIAAQLYISVRAVSSSLDRIRDKTGCRRRADLTRLGLTTSLV
jgi:predicted ATPase/class 3 adenylate cyclase/DNA-binding CsgD family transcriptional regulator